MHMTWHLTTVTTAQKQGRHAFATLKIMNIIRALSKTDDVSCGVCDTLVLTVDLAKRTLSHVALCKFFHNPPYL